MQEKNKISGYNFVVDVDDVLRSLAPNMVKLYNKEFKTNLTVEDVKDYSINVSFPLAKERFGNAYDWFFQTNGHFLFMESSAIEGTAEALKKLREYGTVTIVTKQHSVENKINTLKWLKKNDMEYDAVCFVKDKNMVKCDFFIDDYQNNFFGCGSEESVGILIDAPYNRHVGLEELRQKTKFKKIMRFQSINEFVDYFIKNKIENKQC